MADQIVVMRDGIVEHHHDLVGHGHGVLKLNRFAYYYVAMFILGSVVRYEPELMLIASARYIATAICHQLPIFGRVPLSDAREKIDGKEFSRGAYLSRATW